MMYLKRLLLLFFIETVLAVSKFTKVECIALDKSATDFEYCRLDTIKGGITQISLRAYLFKVPVDNISINFQLMKKPKGYRSLLHDLTFDACRFLKNRKNPVLNFLNTFVARNSNMNHTCPFDHDIIIQKLELIPLPIPRGDYGLRTKWMTYNVPRSIINFYFTA